MRLFRQMILLRLQTINSYKNVTSIYIYIYYYKLSLVYRSGVYGILKMDKTGARAIIKCLQKKDITPEETMALNCNNTLLIHQTRPSMTLICFLNSNHTFLVASLDTIRVIEEYWGGGGGG